MYSQIQMYNKHYNLTQHSGATNNHFFFYTNMNAKYMVLQYL